MKPEAQISQFLTKEFLVGKSIKIVCILIGSFIIYRIGVFAVSKLFLPFKGDERRAQKVKTLEPLLRSILKYGIFFFAFVIILYEFNIDTKAIITAGGILGLAVGFGAQSLVRDVVTGFFILFEGQYSVGDFVEINGVPGIVEEIGLRITKLRDLNGELRYFANGTISNVNNYTYGVLDYIVDVPIVEEGQIDAAKEVLEQIADDLVKQFSKIVLERPEVVEFLKSATSGIILRMRLKILPSQQAIIEKEVPARIKSAFGNAGIELAANRDVLVFADVYRGGG